MAVKSLNSLAKVTINGINPIFRSGISPLSNRHRLVPVTGKLTTTKRISIEMRKYQRPLPSQGGESAYRRQCTRKFCVSKGIGKFYEFLLSKLN